MQTLTVYALILASAATVLPTAAFAQEATTRTPDSTAAAAPPQSADPQDQGAIQDIVVTAQKRSSSVQNTALAITAVGGADLRLREINSVEALAPSLPNVNFGKNVGFARIAIRGVGLDTTVAGQEGRVAYHSDGIYISRPSAAIATFFDVNRVEVVRGPQGTLYGRNATAGAINVITNDPEQTFGGYAKVTLGSYGLFGADAAVTGGLTDTLSARLAIQSVRRGGYGRNFTLKQDIDDEKSFAARAKIKFKPSSGFDVILSADYSHENDQAFVYHYIGAGKPNFVPYGQRFGGTVPADPRDSFGDVPQINKRTFYGFGAVANLDIGFATLTSVTGYRNSETEYDSESDGTQADISNFRIIEQAEQFSQELRLAGEVGGVKYLLGGYYFKEDIYGNVAFSPLRQLSNRVVQGVDYRGDVDTRAYAAFGQLDYEVVRGLTLSAGARYSYEDKAIDHRGVVDMVNLYNPNVPQAYNLFQKEKTNFDSFTPRFGIEYKANRNLLLYFTYAKGFKSGGYSLNAFVPALQPEKLTDYEGGIKAEFLGGKLRTNLAAFYYDYTNLQVQQITNGAAFPINAGSATLKGIEAEITARPVAHLELNANVSYLDSRFGPFSTQDSARLELGVLNIEGNRLPQAPRYTVNLAAAYTVETDIGDFTLRGEGAFTGLNYFSFYNRPEVSQPAYVKGNAFLNFRDARSGISAPLFVRNIANTRTVSSAQVSAGFVGFPILGAFDPPRTFGASLGYNF